MRAIKQSSNQGRKQRRHRRNVNVDGSVAKRDQVEARERKRKR